MSATDHPEGGLAGKDAAVSPEVRWFRFNEDWSRASNDSLSPGTVTSTRPDLPALPLPDLEWLELLGQGGMGTVYRARQTSLARDVAVKIVATDRNDPALLLRFQLEARTLARLHHPNLVQVYECGVFQGQPYLIMDYLGGGSLADLLARESLSVPQAVSLMERIAAAVQCAHDHGIIHRDLKPSNILLTPEREPRVSDFGIAKDTNRDDALTRTGQIVGTPLYMAPEQGDPDGSITTAVDVFALGAILYEMLTGTPPRPSGSPLEAQLRGHRVTPPAPSTLRPDCPADLETICLKCLQYEPRDRYLAAAALAEDLRRFRKGEPIQARPPRRIEILRLWSRRNPALAGLYASVAVLLLGSLFGLTAFVTLLRQKNEELLGSREALQQTNQELETANKREREARQLAEKNATLTLQALNGSVHQLSAHPRLQEADFSDLQKDLLRAMLPFYTRLARQTSAAPRLEADRAMALGKLAELRLHLQEIPQARGDLNEAIAILRTLVKAHPNVAEYQLELGQQERTAGDAAKLVNDFSAAESHYRRALEVLSAPFHPELAFQEQLAGCRNNLGNLARQRGDRARAVQEYTRAIAVLEAPGQHNSKLPSVRVSLARTCANRGIVRYEEQEKGPALADLQRALSLWKGLVHDFPREGYELELARLSVRVGNILVALKDIHQAEAELRHACALLQVMALQFPSIPRYQQEWGNAHNNLGNVLVLRKDLAGAEAEHTRALEIRTRLHTAYPLVPAHACAVAASHANLGKLQLQQGRPEQALAKLDRAVPLLEKVLQEHRENPDARTLLLQVQQMRGTWLSALTRHAEAGKAWKRVAELGPAEPRTVFLLAAAEELARGGEKEEAIRLCDDLARHADQNGEQWFLLAHVYAILTGQEREDRQRDQLGTRAVAYLRRASASNWKPQRRQLNNDWAPLRERPDYQRWLAQLTD